MTEKTPEVRRLGYARVSTYGQTLDTQLEQLRGDGCGVVYREKASGAQADRRELQRLLKALSPGDVVTVARIDRIARSTFDLFAIVKGITDAGAQFRSLAEPWADTATSTGRLMIAVLGGLADVKRDLIRTRTAEGRSRAKARGQHNGPPAGLNPPAGSRSPAAASRWGYPQGVVPELQCWDSDDFEAWELRRHPTRRATKMIGHTRAFAAYKTLSQAHLNFVVLVCHAVPALTADLGLSSAFLSNPPDHFKADRNPKTEVATYVGAYQHELARSTLITVFSYFESYVKDALGEIGLDPTLVSPAATLVV